MSNEDETISMRVTCRGDKELWLKFVNKVREKKKITKQNVWAVLKEYIKEYLKEK